MRRFGLLLLAVLGGLLGVGLTVQAQTAAPATTTLSVATLAPPGSTWMTVFESWNREIRRRSNKSLQLRFFAGGVQGDEAEVIRKIKNGRLDGGAVTAVGLSAIYKPALVFQMPGMFNGYSQLDNARNALAPDLATAFDGAGFKLMGWADVGTTRFFSKNPIASPDDLRNSAQKVWQWRDDEVTPALYSAGGASVVPLHVPEVLGGLTSGTINTILTSPVAAVSLQWIGQVSNMTDLAVSISIGATVFNSTKFNALTPDQQTILRETAEQFHALARRNLRNDETRALGALQDRNVTKVTATNTAAWNTLFSTTRTNLTNVIAPADFISRVQAARGN